MYRHDLAERTTGKASAGNIDEIEPAGLRLDLGLRPHPPQNLLRIGQEGKYRGGWCRDVRLAADNESLFHRSPHWLRWPGPPEADGRRLRDVCSLNRPVERPVPLPQHG